MRGFDEIVSSLPKQFDRLVESVALARDAKFPDRGVYVFHGAQGRPIYGGRSDTIRKRIQSHGRPSSYHGTAPFAFRLAMVQAREQGVAGLTRPRHAREQDAGFGALFRAAKARVAAFKAKAIGIDDPIEQALFEIYAALHFQCPYNDFDNH